MNYLTLGLHYPKEEHFDDVLAIAEKVAVEAKKQDGIIDAGAWVSDNDRVIMMSLWESREAAIKSTPILRPIIQSADFDTWERKPADSMTDLKRLF